MDTSSAYADSPRCIDNWSRSCARPSRDSGRGSLYPYLDDANVKKVKPDPHCALFGTRRSSARAHANVFTHFRSNTTNLTFAEINPSTDCDIAHSRYFLFSMRGPSHRRRRPGNSSVSADCHSCFVEVRKSKPRVRDWLREFT